MENNNKTAAADDTLQHLTGATFALFGDAEIIAAEKLRAELRAKQAEASQANTPPESRPSSPGPK